MAEADDDAGLARAPRPAAGVDRFRRDRGRAAPAVPCAPRSAPPDRRRSSAGSAPGRARPCGRSRDAALRDAGRGSPAPSCRAASTPAAIAAAVISGVSVISVGSSAVVPNGACARQIVSMPSTSGWSLSMTPPPPLTCRSTKPGASMPPPVSIDPHAGRNGCRGDDRLDHAVAHDQGGVVVPGVAVEDAGAGKGEALAHSVSVTLRRFGGWSGLRPRWRAKASTKA